MADQYKKDLPDQAKEIRAPEKRASSIDKEAHFNWDKEKRVEKKEISIDEKIVTAELRREIELMQVDDEAKKTVDKTVSKLEFLGEKEKIEHLLQVARKNGIVYAIQAVKRMNDPYLLDVLHDTLAREGFYQKIMRQTDDDDNNKV